MKQKLSIRLTRHDWKKVADAAEGLAFELLGALDGRSVVELNPSSWNSCAVGEIRRRAGLVREQVPKWSLVALERAYEFGYLVESLLDPARVREEGASQGMLSEATRAFAYDFEAEYMSMSERNERLRTAPVFPLLYLADKARAKAAELAARARGR